MSGSGPVQPNQAHAALSDEEAARSQLYRLLARLLAVEPDAQLLDLLKHLESDGSPIGQALAALAHAARTIDAAAARQEYQALFIGLGRGELVPHGSYYLTGFLNEKPLARLRADLRQLEISRADGNKIPEDHVAALCEVMAGLIDGTLGKPNAVSQQQFFARHMAAWAGRLFGDLERAESARLYAPVGALGRLFMEIEEAAFDMAA